MVDRVPSAPIKALISSLAERKNYGLENSDLPNGLPDGVKELADVGFRGCAISQLDADLN